MKGKEPSATPLASRTLTVSMTVFVSETLTATHWTLPPIPLVPVVSRLSAYTVPGLDKMSATAAARSKCCFMFASSVESVETP
jgi:hypothetical protein